MARRRPPFRPYSGGALALRRPLGARMGALAGMLAALGLMIHVARQPDTWRWVEDLPKKGGPVRRQVAAVPPGAEDADPRVAAAGYPLLPGPTDADPAEQAAAAEEFAVVHDKTAADTQGEMMANGRLFRWLRAQSPAQLWARDAAEATLDDLLRNPRKHRGKLLKFRLKAVQAIDLGSPQHFEPACREKWQVAAFADKSGSRPFLLAVPALPEGFPTGERQFPSERIDFVGYFYKLRTYEDRRDKFTTAPVLVGTFFWHRPASAAGAGTGFAAIPPAALWGAAALTSVALGWRLLRRRRETPAPPPPEDPAALDRWLGGDDPLKDAPAPAANPAPDEFPPLRLG